MLLKLTYLGLIVGVVVLIFVKLFEIFLIWRKKTDCNTKFEKISQTFNVIVTFFIEFVIIVAATLFTIKNFII